ncbi:MAG: BON domain-containing protein [Niabella sp.]
MKRILAAIAIAAFVFTLPACKGKSDADLKTAVETALQANPGLAGAVVDVKDGVATISGEVKDAAAQAAVEAATKAVKGIKSVQNNTTLPAPVVINPDETLTNLVKEAIKDNPTVSASVASGVVTLTGEIKKADLPKLMQKVNALKPQKVENKLTVK